MTTLLNLYNGFRPGKSLLKPLQEAFTIQRQGLGKRNPPPRKRFPPWFAKQTRVQVKEDLTKENVEFIKEVIRDMYPNQNLALGTSSPLKMSTIEPKVEWQPQYQRVGVIARKLGIVPMWMKDGKKILTTMFQVADNHIIKYTPPEKYHPMITTRKTPRPATKGCVIVGADSADPQLFTKEYCGLFNEAGVMPKRLLARFHISPEAALQPGTPLYATHFQVGQYVDVRGKTIDRGFQGVMKRWGFSGMPASHGVTKTHRRGGNIGSGGNKARVMPGTKMPGHMGNRHRILRGLRILRINRKYNVIWVTGQATAGETNSLVQIYDTVLPLKNCKALEQIPHFPTYFPSNEDEELPEEFFVDDLHKFTDPTIMYKEDE